MLNRMMLKITFLKKKKCFENLEDGCFDVFLRLQYKSHGSVIVDNENYKAKGQQQIAKSSF